VISLSDYLWQSTAFAVAPGLLTLVLKNNGADVTSYCRQESCRLVENPQSFPKIFNKIPPRAESRARAVSNMQPFGAGSDKRFHQRKADCAKNGDDICGQKFAKCPRVKRPHGQLVNDRTKLAKSIN
jgi:hypothetical protein